MPKKNKKKWGRGTKQRPQRNHREINYLYQSVTNYFILFKKLDFLQIPSHLDKDLKEHLILRESGKLTNGKTLSVIRTLKQNLSPQEKGEIGKLISTAHNEEARLKGTLDASEKICIHLRVTCDFIQNRRRRALVNFR